MICRHALAYDTLFEAVLDEASHAHAPVNIENWEHCNLFAVCSLSAVEYYYLRSMECRCPLALVLFCRSG